MLKKLKLKIKKLICNHDYKWDDDLCGISFYVCEKCGKEIMRW
jgi:hypothetical protein